MLADSYDGDTPPTAELEGAAPGPPLPFQSDVPGDNDLQPSADGASVGASTERHTAYFAGAESESPSKVSEPQFRPSDPTSDSIYSSESLVHASTKHAKVTTDDKPETLRVATFESHPCLETQGNRMPTFDDIPSTVSQSPSAFASEHQMAGACRDAGHTLADASISRIGLPAAAVAKPDGEQEFVPLTRAILPSGAPSDKLPSDMPTKEAGEPTVWQHELHCTLFRIESRLEELACLPRQVGRLQEVPRFLCQIEELLDRLPLDSTPGSNYTPPKLRPASSNHIAARRLSSKEHVEMPAAARRLDSPERGGSFQPWPQQTRAVTMGSIPLHTLSTPAPLRFGGSTPRTPHRASSKANLPHSTSPVVGTHKGDRHDRHNTWSSEASTQVHTSGANYPWRSDSAPPASLEECIARYNGDEKIDAALPAYPQMRRSKTFGSNNSGDADDVSNPEARFGIEGEPTSGVPAGFPNERGKSASPSRRPSTGDTSNGPSTYTMPMPLENTQKKRRPSFQLVVPVDDENPSNGADSPTRMPPDAFHLAEAMKLMSGSKEGKMHNGPDVPEATSGASPDDEGSSPESDTGSQQFGIRPSANSKEGSNEFKKTTSASISLGSRGACKKQDRLTGRRRSFLGSASVTSSGASTEYSNVSRLSLRSMTELDLKAEQPWMLRPNSAKRLAWDLVIIANTVCIWTLIPLSVVYLESDEIVTKTTRVTLLCIFDMLWPIDIALNFRTGFFLHGKMEMDPALAAANYARGWLVPDVLAAWPLALNTKGVFWIICFFKLGRLVQLLPRISRLQFEFRDRGIFQAKVVLWYFMVIHLATCGWRLSIKAYSPLDEPWYDLYMADLYWVMMTMTTIGYGDITPQDTRSRFYAILLMITGSISFGAMVSTCTHIANSLFNDPIENQVSEMMRFLRRRSVPQELQRLVQRDLRHNLHARQSTVLNPELTAVLSATMQRELALSLLGRTVLRFPLFKDVQRSFLAALAQKHCWLQCLPGDMVVEEGHLLTGLIFIMSGRLQLRRRAELAASCPESFDVCLSQAREMELGNQDDAGLTPYIDGEEFLAGAWMGEACLFDQNRVSVANVAAIEECELAILAAEDYLQVIQRFPSLWDRHQMIQRDLAAGELNVQELAYKPAPPSPQGSLVQTQQLKRSPSYVWKLRVRKKKKEEQGSQYALGDVIPKP